MNIVFLQDQRGFSGQQKNPFFFFFFFKKIIIIENLPQMKQFSIIPGKCPQGRFAE